MGLTLPVDSAIRSALLRAMPTWRERISLGVIVVAISLFTAWYWRYGGPWKLDPRKDAQLANGWVTNCSGPDFRKFSQASGVGPGPARPVFKINDQLVLAVPEGNWPSAGHIEHEPSECRTISDLPKVPYLYFVIQGNWSGSYDGKNLPLDSRNRQVIPDAVTVRIEQYPSAASTSDEAAKVEQVGNKFRNELLDKQEIGGLTCGKGVILPHPSKQGGLLCWVQRPPSDPDKLRLRTAADEEKTPLVFIDATNASKRYGGVLIYWQVSTLDLTHARDIDQAIWNSLAEWNLASEPAARTEAQ